ncbi:hypothetical protein VNI00_001256 [Paramarasmius palmivorus]|uniref:Uncharacterized protein n=1 Tax=Paramarasmius palmivorus TaxID=297713 RepID=A0AAW0E851_9AGAR
MGVSETSNPAQTTTQQPIVIPPLTAEEEDQIVHARITNDERPLRRVVKKFHQYTSVAYEPIVPQPGAPTGGYDESHINNAREAFLVELASFQLMLKKSAMICEAEARQVEEYQREKQRIDDEHGTLRGQIEQLKTSLEHAQILRRRKIEYDVVAEKVNSLPSRDELEQSIQALESDMAAIRAEHETQNRTIQTQKAALDEIIANLGTLRFAGGDRDITASARETPGLDGGLDSEANGSSAPTPAAIKLEDGEEGEEGEDKPVSDDKATAGDIEMGEVEEDDRNTRGKKTREDMEEGEATDTSSALSDPPDDED